MVSVATTVTVGPPTPLSDMTLGALMASLVMVSVALRTPLFVTGEKVISIVHDIPTVSIDGHVSALTANSNALAPVITVSILIAAARLVLVRVTVLAVAIAFRAVPGKDKMAVFACSLPPGLRPHLRPACRHHKLWWYNPARCP